MSDNHYASARGADNAGMAQVIYPRFTTDVAIGPGFSNVWSAYTTLISSVSGDWMVLGAYAKIMGYGDANIVEHGQLQVATGLAGAEIPFATFGDSFWFFTPAAAGSYVGYNRTFLMPPLLVPATTRIRARATQMSDGAHGQCFIFISLFGVPVPFYQRPHRLHRPDAYMRGRTGLGPSQAEADFMILPTPLSQTTVTCGAAAFGNWATVITVANQTSPLLLVGLRALPITPADWLNNAFLAEMGIGEAASAIGIEEVKFCHPGLGYGLAGGYLQLRRPIYIPAGSGVSLRAGGNNGKTISCQIMAVPLK
ncbi:MAG: hypothetical protein MUP14_07875 [Dehalococcoidia bacterium]|nr:hypothetical protein [Dehalococcoidia bacterium]